MEALQTSCCCCNPSVSSISNSFSRAFPSSSLAGIPRLVSRNFGVPSSLKCIKSGWNTKFNSPRVKKPSNSEKLAGSFVVRSESGTGRVSTVRPTEWVQKQFELPGFSRGCHIITRRIVSAVPEIKEFEVGIAHIFVLHTSCSLTINENASSDVPLDMEDYLNRLVPEGHHYRHLDEGLDDLPAHVKASMMGSSLTIPIRAGRLNLGIWQGIWLNEHRNYGGSRTICITIQGQKRADGRVYK